MSKMTTTFDDSYLLDEIPNLKYVETWSYYEGPLIGVFVLGEQKYLYTWTDQGKKHTRWLAVTMSEEQYANLVSDQLNFHTYIISHEFCFIVDQIQDKMVRAWKVPIKELPESYLPTTDAGMMELDLEEVAASRNDT